MDLRAIQIFLEVCECGSLTSAARKLGISQAAVSQRIAQLERELEISLFDRTSRRQRLLPAGALLHERGRRLIGEVDELRHQLERFRHAELPELRVGVIESIALALVPRMVPELRGLAGMLSVMSGVVGPLIPELLRGNLDIIITSEQIDDMLGLESHPLIVEPFVLLLPKGVPPPAEPEDLARLARTLTFIRYGAHRQMGPIIDRQLHRFGIELPHTLDFVSSTPVVDLVRQGLGWSILTPLCLYSARLGEDELTVAPLPQISFSRRIQLAATANRFGDVPRRTAELCLRVMSEDVAPKLKALAPFAADLVVCGPAPSS